MNKEDLKKALMEAWQREAELKEIIEQALCERFAEFEQATSRETILYNFHDDYNDGLEWNGCLQGWKYHVDNIEKRWKEYQERIQKNKQI